MGLPWFRLMRGNEEMNMTRRELLKGIAAMLGSGVMGRTALAEMLAHPLAGKTLPPWERGHFRIGMIYTGRSESQFLVFPDGTSMLIDCGDTGPGRPNETPVMPVLPDPARRPGEWACRYVLRENPNGRKVDYFLLSHWHVDHCGSFRRWRENAMSADGRYALSGIGEAIDHLDFGTIIDRAWPDVEEPVPRTKKAEIEALKVIGGAYAEAQRRGTKVEKFRLEKAFGQIALRHGGCAAFDIHPLCANGRILRRDGTLLDLGTLGTPNTLSDDNTLSIGLVFSLGPFRYYTAGDFWGYAAGPDGKRVNFEDVLAKEAPLVDVAKANHHAHCTMPLSLVRALHARVVLGSVWSRLHSQRSVLRKFAKARHPFLYVPGFLPKRPEDDGEKWLGNVARECFEGIHAVVDVQPDGRKYRLMLVTARDESWRILGAYDFNTYHKGDRLS